MPDNGSQGLLVSLKGDTQHTDSPILAGALSSPFFFQMPPLETFSVTYSFQHNDFYTFGPGQVSRKGSRQLRIVTFDTLLLDFHNFMIYDFNPQRDNIAAMHAHTDRLVEITESGSPFLLDAHHTGDGVTPDALIDAPQAEIRMLATLRSFKVDERAGEGDTRYLTVEFHEFVPQVVLARGSSEEAQGTRYHSLNIGDTLHIISRQEYHNVGHPYYEAIRKANPATIPPNYGAMKRLDMIPAGQPGANNTIGYGVGPATKIIIPPMPKKSHHKRKK